jgi:hypothetical protein
VIDDSPAKILYNTDGYELSIKNNSVSNASQSGIIIAGYDGSNHRFIRVDNQGYLQYVQKESPTFTTVAASIVIGNNKSMISIANSSSSAICKIQEIYVVNVQSAAVTGILGTFELRRITSHSGGTTVSNISTLDTLDTLDSNITIRTNSTVSGENSSLLWRSIFSTDEWGTGNLDTESNDHSLQVFFPIFSKKTSGTKPIVLRNNEGLNLKFATNSSSGSFDIMIVFTQE